MSSADFRPAQNVTLVSGRPHLLTRSQEAAVTACWQSALEGNPTLFNGPVVSPISVQVTGSVCTIQWHRSDYAHYLFSRQSPDCPPTDLIGTLFVSVVVPTTDGRFVVGRMSQRTSAPGVIQLPGGGVSISPDQVDVSHQNLLTAAVRETGEEMGITVDPASLRIYGVIKRTRPLDVGVVFTAEPRPWADIDEAFAALRQRELDAGVVPEFDELLAIPPSANLTRVSGSTAPGSSIDYLPSVAHALSATGWGVVA